MVPRATTPSVTLHTYHPPLSHLSHERLVSETLTQGLSRPLGVLHQTTTAMCFQFPETRLIQYDCGEWEGQSVGGLLVCDVWYGVATASVCSGD